MQSKISALYFRLLPNAAHYNYFTHVRKALDNAAPAVKTALGALLPSFNEWHAKEEQAMEWVRKSAFTTLIVESFRRTEHILVGFSSQVRGLEYNPEPAVATAAHRIRLMLKNYGRVCRKAYEAFSGDMRVILQHLQDDYAADVATLGLAEWVSALEAAFTEFQARLAQRDAQSLKKPADTFTAVRGHMEKLYHKIGHILNACAITSPDAPVFVALIQQLNPEIERLNAEYHRHRYAIANAEPAPIPPQPYAGGLPVTPVPDVYYTPLHGETKKLALGKDYNLSYKNNTHPGNAQCTLYGKGRYTGRKTVTFIIQDMGR
jgi:hypothetical protein